jgi:hypothetical protein
MKVAAPPERSMLLSSEKYRRQKRMHFDVQPIGREQLGLDFVQ